MNLKLFKKRLIAFYSCWRKQKRDLWENSDVLAICSRPPDSPGNMTHPISSLFFYWLMGHDFPGTIAVFTINEIHFICSWKKSFSMLQTLESPAMEAVNAKLIVHMKNKDDNGLEFMDGIIRAMKVTYNFMTDSNKARLLVVGYISGEPPKSKLLGSCLNNLKPKDFQCVHVIGVSRLLNHYQDVKYSGDARDRRDLESFEENISSYKVDSGSHQCCVQIQMQSLPEKLEQMLALPPDRKNEASSKADDRKSQLERGNGTLPGILQDKGEKSSHFVEVEGNYGVYDEADEWVLVEDGGEEEYMGKMDKGNGWKQSMALANYKL